MWLETVALQDKLLGKRHPWIINEEAIPEQSLELPSGWVAEDQPDLWTDYQKCYRAKHHRQSKTKDSSQTTGHWQ